RIGLGRLPTLALDDAEHPALAREDDVAHSIRSEEGAPLAGILIFDLAAGESPGTENVGPIIRDRGSSRERQAEDTHQPSGHRRPPVGWRCNRTRAAQFAATAARGR